jgi:hypothetical protein
MITISINLEAVEKSRIFEGKKGRYLDMVLIETPNSPHNDYMVVQSVSKEEREQGIKGNILGNGKTIVKRDPTNYNTPPDETINDADFDPDLGF